MTAGEAPVELAPYDPAWPALFQDECARLHTLLAPWLAGSIEHIGSTAVPGMMAKPVIDIMAGVETLETSRPAIAAVTSFGYCYFVYQAHLEHWFCKPSFEHRTHHVHLVPFESELWHQRLAFRDALRANDALAAEYAELKQVLARTFEFDREAYTDAKAPFIARVLGLAAI